MDINYRNQLLHYIRKNNAVEFIELVEYILNEKKEYQNHTYLFQLCLNNSILYERVEIVSFLINLYSQMDITDRCALKPLFAYASYLARNKQNKTILSLLSNIIA
jgi:hypothetical protein